MISTRNILIKIGNSGKGQVLSPDNLSKLHKHLFKIYRDIEKVCNNHGLKICLAYGNVIGAMRHGGWIPWDDDLDIHMSREDYDKFLSFYSSELPPQYQVSSYLSEKGSFSRFAKVIDTTTVNVPIGESKTDESGVYIDIFPIDNVKAQPRLNVIRRYWAYFLMYTAASVYQVQEGTREYRDLMFSSKAGRANWYFRQLWGIIFGFTSYRTWNRWIENYAKYSKHTGKVHIMADLWACYRMIPEDYFFPFREIELPEIGKVHIPNKYNEYLKFFYGDWRKIPNDADKWHHYVSEFYIPD